MMDNWQDNAINIRSTQPGPGHSSVGRVLALYEDLIPNTFVAEPGVWCVV